ncbi:polynucleotide 5'-hydroxyl-kinase NOL9 isoform X1 [Dendroctonus ponderosae]|uniref:polynucleotide 5'-hydroxyl-kinase NOL9 isoform X1 n=1 Tax=Dendroctonus ponderosae TaxID=77166 RepID=UPI00203620AD|nr:polynucleotide 5'-hydroxyl-kinase NOL9 isoform X1 [Dendroctonus ponderosae]KAH1012290.1 hypothetical protein HUJ05_011471 [Dendroctonus ponderosae]
MAKLEENYLQTVRENLYKPRSIQRAAKEPTTVKASKQVKNNHRAPPKTHAKKNVHPVKAPEPSSSDGLDKIPANTSRSSPTSCVHQGHVSDRKPPKSKHRSYADWNVSPIPPQKRRKLSQRSQDWEVSKVEPNTNPQRVVKASNSISPASEDLADFYDDATITVQGLKIERFFNQFPPKHNYSLGSTISILPIPSKILRSVQEDEDDPMDSHLDSPGNTAVNGENGNELDELVDSSHGSDMETDIVLEEESHIPAPPNRTMFILKNGSRVIVLDELNERVYFNGLFCLKVLNGQVEVLGANFDTTSSEVKLYSPRGTSLLYLRNSSELYVDNKAVLCLKDLVPHHLLSEHQMSLRFKPHCAIILCRELNEPSTDFIKSHIAQKIYPDNALSQPNIDFDLLGSFNRTDISMEWKNALESVHLNSKLVICGGKGVGKSTFLRYSINTLLKQHGKITVVDLDPGQSEFNPPGFVSVSTIEDYILGPNFTHLQTPDISILSHINMGQNIQHYLKTVRVLMQSADFPSGNFPVLINFPGYTQDLGMEIAGNLFQVITPDVVIELKSTKANRNYKMPVTAANINTILQSSILRDENVNGNSVDFQHILLESLSEKNTAWSLETRQSREFSVLAYFGKLMSSSVQDLTSPNIDMFCINLSKLKIVNQDGQSISPLAANGNVVALCSLSLQDPEIFISYGYGFIRGMDLEQDTLVLLTPEPLERLEKADHLVLSSVTTPPSLIMSAGNVKSQVPYLSSGELIEFGQLTKRSYVPPKK